MSRPRLIDLSHRIESGQSGYPGFPAPRIEPHLSHGASRASYGGVAEFEISRIFMVGNTGTYLDSPYHRYPGRPDIADLPLERLAALPGIRLDARFDDDGRSVGLDLPSEIIGSAVLVRTGWDRRRGTPDYWSPGPFLSPTAVDGLIDGGASLIGVDFWNVDDTSDPARPAHTRLLDAGILIVEHLTGLAAVPSTGFRFSAVPPPVRGAASFPVRAYAELTGGDDEG